MPNEFFLGRLTTFRFELGRALISGRNPFSVFDIIGDGGLWFTSCNLSTIYCFSAIFSFLALNLLISKPPPVNNSFLAFLSSSTRTFVSYCSLRCLLYASSALFCVYFLFYSSKAYFLSFYSRRRWRSISAFLFLSSSLISLSLLFFYESYFYF